MNKIVAMILAGGQGSRLSILSQRRAKPAVPFGGIFRIIDFTLSNVMHSGIPYCGILTQYKPYSLMDHIRMGESWGFGGRNRTAKILPPYVGEEDYDWYAGTADAVYQNLDFLDRFNPDLVVVLSGDHIYKMDYRDMIRFHLEKQADLTVATQPVPEEEISRFGILEADDDARIVNFLEKPKEAPSDLASLGIYVFNSNILRQSLFEDANSDSDHDFGRNIIPTMIHAHRVYTFKFNGYWRDVGTIKTYWDTNMEILDPSSSLDLARWQVRTNAAQIDLCDHVPLRITNHARVSHSFVSRGCTIEGTVENSILSPGVHVARGAIVTGSIIMNDTSIGEQCQLVNVILDKNCRIGPRSTIGIGDNIPNSQQPHLLDSGITVFGKGASLPPECAVGKNCLIYPDVTPADFETPDMPSGTTIFHRA